MSYRRPAPRMSHDSFPVLTLILTAELSSPVDFPLSAMLEPGGIGILRYAFIYGYRLEILTTNSYQHHNIDEPAFLLGMALPEDHQSDTPA